MIKEKEIYRIKGCREMVICGGIREGRFRALKRALSLLWPNEKVIC